MKYLIIWLIIPFGVPFFYIGFVKLFELHSDFQTQLFITIPIMMFLQIITYVVLTAMETED